MQDVFELNPELLLEQSQEMVSLRAAYESLFNSVSSDLQGINRSWSDLLSNNFAGKIASVQNTFSGALNMLQNSASAASLVANTAIEMDNSWAAKISGASMSAGSSAALSAGSGTLLTLLNGVYNAKDSELLDALKLSSTDPSQWSDVIKKFLSEKGNGGVSNLEKMLKSLEITKDEAVSPTGDTVQDPAQNAAAEAPAEPEKPQYQELPAWARQDIRIYKDGDGDENLSFTAANGATGSVYAWNNPAHSQVSCTYYTLKRLYERGVGYPFASAGNANGNQWFYNCTEDVTKESGNNAIDTLYNTYGTLENVVVSFQGPSDAGHVLLVDRVYQNETTGQVMVQYSDMNMNGSGSVNNLNGYNPTANISLDEFKAKYQSSNGDMVGAVVIGS